jgi:Tol biopolymer transport system component
MPLSTGQILNNRYRIVKLLGQGGFGAVYRAWDKNLKGPCAVKENLDTTPEAQHQFEREAMMLAKLHHQNLPRVIDHFTLPAQGQYLVMDFIDGDNLEQILVKNAAPLPEDLVLSWLQQICSALTYLHAQQPPVIHRDIKPANIKVTPQGQVYLVDFGIAKIFDAHLRTTVGARAVTPGYSPPEQYGLGKTDPRSDIYALGATLYKALTGREPTESVQRTIGMQLPSPRQLNQAIHPRTEALILKAMDTTPTNRFQSIAELIASLQGQDLPKQSHTRRPNWMLVGGGAGALFLCVGLIIGGIAINSWLQRQSGFNPPSIASRPSATDEVAASHTPPISTSHPPSSSASPTGFYPSATGFDIANNPNIIYTAAAQTVSVHITEAALSTHNAALTLPPSPLPPTLGLTTTPTSSSTPSMTPTPPLTQTPTPTTTTFPSGGGLIAFHSTRSGNYDIWVMNTDGSNPRQITYDSSWDSIPAWSPDGRELAFQSNRDGDFEIYIYNLASTSTRQVTFNSCADYAPAFSPDGNRLVYYSNCNSGEDQREIFVINIDGSNNQQLTDYGDNNNRYPAWSHDGGWITFTGYDGDGYYVHVMRTNGADIRRITRGCISSFSPDDSQILFTSYCQGGEVNVMNTDGANIRQLTDTPSYENSTPAWSSDGTRILFQSDRDGDSEIFVMNADGSGQTQLTFNTIHDGAAVWQP